MRGSCEHLLLRSLDSSAHGPRCKFDSRLNAVIRHAAAQCPRHCFADLLIGGIRIPVEQRLRRHDLPVLAEAALWNLLFDPGLLYRMELAVLCEPFQRRDLSLHRRCRRDARPGRNTVDDHGARSALSQAAAEAWPLQVEIVSQYVKQRSRGINIDGTRRAIDPQSDVAHCGLLWESESGERGISKLDDSRISNPEIRNWTRKRFITL